MSSRTTSRTVTFPRPFTLRGLNGEQPAGNYVVETDEELIHELSFPAYRRTATWLLLPQRPGGDGAQVARVDPDELDAALNVA